MANATQLAWVQKVFGLKLAGAADHAEHEPADGADGTERLLADLAVQASVLAEPVRSAMLARVKQTRAHPDIGEIHVLADAIAAAAKTARVEEAKAQSGNTVTFRLLQKKWLDAEARARKEFDSFLDEMLGDPDLQQDERYPKLQADAGRLANLIPDDGGQLVAVLGVLDDANDMERPQAQKKAMAALDAYRADVAAAQALKDLQGIADRFYSQQPFLSELETVLADLGTELAKRA